ncbi:MAG: ribosome maturation factor RimP [Oscillospiraceae bacterium]|nr:ribosome maturation factor RimP [Oscillospiraceae bacterium]
MKKKQIEKTIREITAGIIENLGYELWNVEYYHDGAEQLLEITIDSADSGISLDDCEKVTRAVIPAIDEADPIECAYSLAVSSPGLNRELKNGAHLDKYINKEVTVKLFAKNDSIKTGEKSFNAVLKEFSRESFSFEIIPGNTPVTIIKKEIARICAYDKINI